MKKMIVFLSIVLILSVGLFLWVQKTSVATQSDPHTSFFDDFDAVLLKPDPDAAWWIRNLTDGAILEEQACSEDACIRAQQEDGIGFVEFVLFPDEQPGDYTNAEMAELQSGYVYGDAGVWQPAPGQPIVLEARVRWIGDFHQDGKGDAVGSSGIWLWNSPPDYATQTFHPQIAVGFSWASDENMVPGLTGMVMINNFPAVVKKPAAEVNMNEWVELKLEWQMGQAGDQTVSFWINDQLIDTAVMPVPINQALSLELWHDNQAYQLSRVELQNPAEEQKFQVDYLRVYQK